MNRRTLTTMALLGLAVVFATASPQIGFAQSDPFAGLWQLNLAKSKYSPGPPSKAGTMYIHGEGQNRKDSTVGINAEGNPGVAVFTHIYDGNPHPVTGSPDIDASAYTRADANTLNYRYLKAGNVVGTGTIVASQDGKTLTIVYTGTNANGQQFNNILVLDKQ